MKITISQFVIICIGSLALGFFQLSLGVVAFVVGLLSCGFTYFASQNQDGVQEDRPQAVNEFSQKGEMISQSVCLSVSPV